MQRISALTGETLADLGFGLYIPTETLSDALMQREASGEPPRHLVDCDTSSLILLTVAKSYGLPASLVDITLPSGSGHNYVRWQVDSNSYFDWDTNGRSECTTPSGLPSYEGRGMTHDQTKAYLFFVRALIWKKRQNYERAVADYRRATTLDPTQPDPLNNVAWMIATRDFPGRQNEKQFALSAATQAVAIRPSANQLDTLACTHALNGDFAQAATVQARAIVADPDNSEFRERLAMFQGLSPRDCTGLT
jgi:tetratricopeptide (TPR) repeat protein